MSRFPLFSFRSFFTLFTKANSTSWPGASRFAIPLLCSCLLIAIAQLTVNLSLGIRLLRIGDSVVCQYDHDTLGAGDDVRSLPITYANRDTWETNKKDFLGMHKNRGKAEIGAAFFGTPLLTIAIMVIHICLHFRRLSNRAGMLFAICLITLFLISNGHDHWLNIDANKLHKEYSWCWKSSEEMKGLWAERMTRWRLLVAGEVLSGIGGLCIALYFALATMAASTNRYYDQQRSTRLHNLRSTPYPNADGNTNGVGIPSSHLSPPQASTANTPASGSGLILPRITVGPKEHMAEANSEVFENPFADPEPPVRTVYPAGAVKPGATTQDPETGERRKDSAR
ncbi:uncharacterized protein K460DRAFT_418477 [Cucurbitaria berberidis CBS 394.84]|uniref:Uncharacterized protein n=1 Tax=Cucurbitaria berberidis CBS 394.84 TaxID=1168544 RepID=A0A9P4GDT3_9PLEO|nr:uncharacterized protein K460DRAFT_418477 [Cucurbitaria berberidis CBS 394.84]KAF1843414.1 hypothetical protein K460DRAFT_418477 [Cucurbitaria berberidis CBS 394.84]